MPRTLNRRIRKTVSRMRKAIGSAWNAWPHALDRAIYTIAPSAGARRMAVRRQWNVAKRRDAALNAIFEGAEEDRTHGYRWIGARTTADDAAEQDLEGLRIHCEELYRNNTIAHGAIEGRVSHEVGTGILPQGRVTSDDEHIGEDQARAINQRLEDVVRRWSENGVDRTGLHSLVQIEKQVDREFAIYGESFIEVGDRGGADRPIPLVLDVISPLCIETPPEASGDPNVRLGIRYDNDGRVLGYYKRRAHPYDTKRTDLQYDYIPRLDANGHIRMLHVFDPVFSGQTRGLPWMAAAINRLKDAEDIVEFTIISMQVEACFSAFVKPGKGGAAPHDMATGAAAATDADGNRIEELRPGSVEYLNAGEEVEFGNPQRPGSTFLPMIQFTLRSISAALNYPYELLANDFFRTTFSSGRLSMMMGRLGFNMRRQVLVEKMLQPIWRRIVFESILVGELDGLVSTGEYAAAPHRYERHIWQARSGIVHINPEQEVSAHQIELETNTNTLADIFAEGGLDWEDRLRQRYTERAKLVEQDVELEALRTRLRQELGLPSTSATEPTPAGVA
jgi:lambda family phage portal protein